MPHLVNGFNLGTKNIYEKRKEDLDEFLMHKDIPLIFFSPTPADIMINNDRYDYKYFVPIKPFDLKVEQGKSFNTIPNTIFSEFINKYKELFKYEAFFTDKTGLTIAETLHTKKPLAFYNTDAIFLPAFINNLKDKEGQFLNELIDIAKRIKSKNKSQLPNWANLYFLPNERRLKTEVDSIKKEITSLENNLNEKNIGLEIYSHKKTLFSGTGNELENEVEEVFRQMGFEILEKEINRDDLVVKFGDTIAVVEIKGVNGSSAEKHAAQLEKWVSNYYEVNDVKPKGILLINAFRELEISERNEPAFPNQMLKFSIQREHCLITTIQLLGVYYSIQNSPEKKELIIQKLLNTKGLFKDFLDWTKFIETDLNLKESAK